MVAIHPLIKKRWSPRAMSSEPLSDEDMQSLFEAARWAPSSFNEQPWRFILCKAKTDSFDKAFSALVERNQSWAKNSSLLVITLSRTKFTRNDKPSTIHSFDTGAAWENLALEATNKNIVVHGMQGFDYEKIKTLFSIPELYKIEMMIAVGKPAPLDVLPDGLRSEEKPKDRKPLDSIISFDTFDFS